MEKKIREELKKILAIETSGKTLSLALMVEGETKAKLLLNVGLKHSELLKESCEFILKGGACKKEELTHLAVSTGPGSFTGLRVGITFARTIAQFLKIPLIGIPVFEILAKGLDQSDGLPSAILIDSIGNELFAGFFEKGSTRPSKPYQILTILDLAKKINRPTILAGEGYLRYEEQMKRTLGDLAVPARATEHISKAENLAALAWERIQKNRRLHAPWEKVLPFYLREPLAVERLKKRGV